jgi:hypothetical protein
MCCAAITLLSLIASGAVAQQAPLAPANQPGPSAAPPAAQIPGPPVAPPPVPEAPKKEGFFDAIEKWWDKSAADLKASVDESKESWRKLNERNEQASKDAAAAARDAAEALMKFPNTKIVEGKERCEIAPNGSPDCNTAAEKICKTKGFTIGKSADIQTSRKCSARAWLSGNPSESACSLETIVTKAACQ